MNAGWIACVSLSLFVVAYRLYSRLLDRQLFRLDAARPTPSHTHTDNVDFCPTRPLVLFGHHFASICGLGPIVGPALAAIYGWLPVFLWITLGVIFIGAAHDFGALVLSTRFQGRSIGDVTKELIGPRARLLFLLLIFFLIALAMGVFASVIATLFDAEHHPEVVIPSGALILIAVVIGQLVHRRRLSLGRATLIGLICMLASLWLGQQFPITGLTRLQWIMLLLAYSSVASALPVWVLLQPRDYLNSFFLYAGIALMYLGLFVWRPPIVAPAINHVATDLPPLFPFLCITVACGAVSGFHSLVCSGTTAKQLDREPQARPIGYGGMLLEGAMAIAVLLACTAGVASAEHWHAHYSSWGAASGLGPSLGMFIQGAAALMTHIGISREFATVFISVVVVGFALTTLDSATRLLRYNIEELGHTLHMPFVTNRYVASLLAVLAIGYFALMPSGKALWQLFGTTNQLLAGLALLAVTIYLVQQRRPTWYYAVPMLLMFVTTVTAMLLQLRTFVQQGAHALAVVSSIILALAVWLVIEAIIGYLATHRPRSFRQGQV